MFSTNLITVRLCLSELVVRSFQLFREGVSKEFGDTVGLWLAAITASQFHFMFYMGRTLPNIMALPGGKRNGGVCSNFRR